MGGRWAVSAFPTGSGGGEQKDLKDLPTVQTDSGTSAAALHRQEVRLSNFVRDFSFLNIYIIS